MHGRLYLTAALLAAGALARAAGPGAAIVRVSVPVFGAGGEYGGGSSCVSADGRFVAFDSYAGDVAPGDSNGMWDVFVRDTQAGITQRVSLTSTGAQGNGPSHSPAMTPDGRFVAFWSKASNLVPGDTNGGWDVFLRDRQTNTLQRVSLSSTQAQSARDDVSLGGLSISDDGRFVAFTSAATNLVSGDTNGVPDVFVRDTIARTTVRASVSSGGVQGNNISGGPSLSADGRYVAFQSYASNLVPGDTNGTADVFVRDLQTNTTTRVSAAGSGAEGNAWSGNPIISGNGRYVALESYASNLAPGDVFQTADVFVKDRQTGAVNRAGAPPPGSDERGSSYMPRISADGRFVAFLSAEALVPDDYAAPRGLYVRNLVTNELARVSLPTTEDGSAYRADLPAISADGRFVAFQSDADIPSGDATLRRYDVYLRDLSVPAVAPLTFADAADALRIAAGLTEATPRDATRLNVAEPPAVDLHDALTIARSAAAL